VRVRVVVMVVVDGVAGHTNLSKSFPLFQENAKRILEG